MDDEDYEDDEIDDNNKAIFANQLCTHSPSGVPKHWILLDNQSTVSVF